MSAIVTSREHVAVRESEFARALRQDGLRLTHQRLEIIGELARADDHPDADTIFRRVRERVPSISPDTVYRTLSVLAERRALERISMPRATRFDPDGSLHHHFVCELCGRLEDVSEELVAAPHVPETIPGLGEISSVRLQLRGVCADCKDGGE